MKKKTALALLALLPLVAFAAEPVRLFREPGGGPGKVNPLTLKDQLLHPSSEFFYNENYFLIAITDAGHYGYVNILISNTGAKPGMPAVSFTIVTPDKKRLVKDLDYQPEDLKMARDKFDLRIGANSFRQTPAGYDLKVGDQTLGMELSYVNRVPGLKVGDGRAVFGAKGEDIMYINYPGPRPDVTGKFFINGKVVPVAGWGYIDHSYTVTNPSNFEETWHNLKFRSDTHTLLISSFGAPDKFERDFALAIVTDQNRVICVSTDVKVTEEQVKKDAESGKMYPGRVRYEVRGDACTVKAVMDSSRLTEKFDVLAKLDRKAWGKAAKFVINTFIAEPWYFRSVGPVEIELTAGGQTSKIKGNAFNEIIFTQ